MPRHKSGVKMSGIKVRIPEELLARVHLMLLDPARGRIRYGNLTNLMTQLLNDWVNRQIQRES